MSDIYEIDDGRGQFPVVVKARATVELRDAVRRAAAFEKLTTGAFVRRALSERTTSVLGNAGVDQEQAIDSTDLKDCSHTHAYRSAK